MLDLQQAIKCTKLQNFLLKEDLSAIDHEINQDLLHFLDGYNQSSFVSSLLSKTYSYVCGHHTHVIGYHGCRCKDESSYRLNGIIASDRNTQIELAGEVFKGLDFAKGLGNLGNGDPGSVGLLLILDTRSCYLQGSEFIQQIASGIGTDEAQKRLERLGAPTIIKCKVHITHKTTNKDRFSDPSVGFLYSHILLKNLITRRAKEGYNLDGGFTLQGSISPQNILNIKTV